MNIFDQFFYNVKEFLKDHIDKVTDPNKPEHGTVTFDKDGNLITITDTDEKVVVEVNKPAKTEEIYDMTEDDNMDEIIQKPAAVPQMPEQQAQPDPIKQETANNIVLNIVTDLVEALKKK